MDDKSAKPKRLVQFGSLAAQDFSDNYDHTAFHWGIDQAESYSKLLLEAADRAAEFPESGKMVENHPEFRAIYVKWSKAKYGHFLIYRITPDGIYLLRILHSAMNVAEHL